MFILPHPPLWVWGSALAPRGSSITNIQLQRHRAAASDPTKCIKTDGKLPKHLRPGISTSMSTTDLFLPDTAWQWSAVCYYRISQLGPRNGTQYFLLSVCFCLASWLCLKMGSGSMVLIWLLKIGAKDLTPWCEMRWSLLRDGFPSAGLTRLVYYDFTYFLFLSSFLKAVFS